MLLKHKRYHIDLSASYQQRTQFNSRCDWIWEQLIHSLASFLDPGR